VDTLDYPHHPMKGGLYRAAFSAYSDRDFGQYSFRRYEAEGLQVFRSRRICGFSPSTTGVFSPIHHLETPSRSYMLPSLGGKDTLRGFRSRPAPRISPNSAALAFPRIACCYTRAQNATSNRSWNARPFGTIASVLGWITYWKSGCTASQLAS
jgi:hypothetical protein